MTVIIKQDFTLLAANAPIYGTVPKSAAGVDWSSAWASPNSHGLKPLVTGEGLGPAADVNAYMGQLVIGDLPPDVQLTVKIRTTGSSATKVWGGGASATSAENGAVTAEYNTGTGALVMRYKIGTNSTMPLYSTTVAPPAAPVEFFLRLRIEPLRTCVQVLAADGATVLRDSGWQTLPADRPSGNFGGLGYYWSSTPNTIRFLAVEVDDLAIGAKPALSAPTAKKSGKRSATGTVSTTVGSGTLYAAVTASSTPLTANEVKAQGQAQAVTAAGVQNVTLNNVTNAGTTRYIQYAHMSTTFATSDVVVSATSFTTDPPLAAPTGTATRTLGGQSVTVSGTYDGTVWAIAVSIPVASSSPGGAVAQSPKAAIFSDGTYTVTFDSLPPGSYGSSVIILSNEDNPVVALSAPAFSINEIGGNPTAPGVTSSVAFAGPVPAQTAHVGVPFSLDLAAYFTGTQVPFTYALQAGSLGSNGLTRTGAVISGTPTSTATLSGLVMRATDTGAATADTNAFAITIAAAAVAPTIATHPASMTRTVGQTATLTVAASGTAPLAYQWKRGGVDISGATSASYTTAALVLGDNGAVFTCAVSNGAGTVTSSGATLTVQAAVVAPTITAQPAATAVTVGATATFTVVATNGEGTLSYQWRKGGVAISGATSASHTTSATVLGDSGAVYSVVVTNSAGSVTSADAVLTVSAALPPGPGQRLPASRAWFFDMLARAGQ